MGRRTKPGIFRITHIFFRRQQIAKQYKQSVSGWVNKKKNDLTESKQKNRSDFSERFFNICLFLKWSAECSNFRCDSTELLEVLLEFLCQFRCFLVISFFVCPCIAWVQYFCWHSWYFYRNLEAEDRFFFSRYVVQLAFDGSANHCTRVRKLHAAADSVDAASPTCVDKEDLNAVLIDFIAEHFCIDRCVQRKEW